MDQLDREAAQFSQPVRQIASMVLVLGLVAVGAYIAFPRVAPVFLANPYLNGFIAFVFIIGVFACFWQAFQLVSSVRWIEGYVEERPGHHLTRAPRLLAPLATLLRTRAARMQIGAASSRSILESVATRIDEARDITRYITNLLIFLGLLGTFFGLATTVPAVVETIRSLNPQEGDSGVEVFGNLMNGLEAQLGGMGVAFSSSLLGLAGSLVVGLLELFAGHGQNRFYRELEEWLSSITRLSYSSGDAEAGGETGAIAQLADLMAEQLETLTGTVANAVAGQSETDAKLAKLADAVEGLSQRLESGAETAPAMRRLADAQDRLSGAIETQTRDGGSAIDAESRMRLRSMDVQLLRILEEMSAGRQETLADLRAELSRLSQAMEASNRDRAG
ncbi:MAG: biopolymer transporter ExbB [Rhodobacteraceae bacterium]|nr:biopolymer transporter ExbB [Paracoccaceae bacterium]